ncbi:unnamed protein product, partial [Didymodactylos carnosus]
TQIRYLRFDQYYPLSLPSLEQLSHLHTLIIDDPRLESLKHLLYGNVLKIGQNISSYPLVYMEKLYEQIFVLNTFPYLKHSQLPHADLKLSVPVPGKIVPTFDYLKIDYCNKQNFYLLIKQSQSFSVMFNPHMWQEPLSTPALSVPHLIRLSIDGETSFNELKVLFDNIPMLKRFSLITHLSESMDKTVEWWKTICTEKLKYLETVHCSYTIIIEDIEKEESIEKQIILFQRIKCQFIFKMTYDPYSNF